MSYWDTLQRIILTAEMLQRCPIPKNEVIQNANLQKLAIAHDNLRDMLRMVAPCLEVWCGHPDDPIRNGRILAVNLDELIK